MAPTFDLKRQVIEAWRTSKVGRVMNVFLWIVQGALAALFLFAGAMKLLQSKKRLADSGRGMAWVEDFSEGTVKLIGGLEVLAAIGLILPAVTGIAPILVPVTAVGLVLMQASAAYTHLRRKERQVVPINVLLIVLAVVVAWGRFGPYSF
jgi:hypothetical protein